MVQKLERRSRVDELVIRVLRRALEVADRIRACRREVEALASGIGGMYIEPGPSGSPLRGRIEVLPTGRNFYLINPRCIPTRAAWRVGVESARRLLKYYLERHGRYPECVGEVLWSIDAFKADGEQISQILYLLGVEPVWDSNGVVRGVRVIPLEELGRPRIDVLVRISGIVRDTLPNYISLIDKAVSLIVSLEEPPEMNYPRKHYLEDIERIVRMGVEPERARRVARYRVFGAPPGAYGAGVNYAIEASAWKSRSDLAKIWIDWGGYAYGEDSYGVEAHEEFVLGLKRVELVSRNHQSDEHDLLGCCCYFSYHGGFYNTIKDLTGRSVDAVVVDTRDYSMVEVRDLKLEIERVVRTKLLSRKWIEDMKKHGYRGASDMQRRILHVYGWGSTTGLVEDWVYTRIAETYILDEEMRRWFEKHNPWAAEEIARRLIEAAERGVWKAPPELLERLREAYSEIEGVLEDDSPRGEVQGGAISIVSYDEVGGWAERIRRVEGLLEKLGGSGGGGSS